MFVSNIKSRVWGLTKKNLLSIFLENRNPLKKVKALLRLHILFFQLDSRAFLGFQWTWKEKGFFLPVFIIKDLLKLPKFKIRLVKNIKAAVPGRSREKWRFQTVPPPQEEINFSRKILQFFISFFFVWNRLMLKSFPFRSRPKIDQFLFFLFLNKNIINWERSVGRKTFLNKYHKAKKKLLAKNFERRWGLALKMVTVFYRPVGRKRALFRWRRFPILF